MLPLRPGKAEGVTHDYKRHGTTTLFAALDVLDGTVLGRCMPRHRHQEFLALSATRSTRAVPADLEIHVILDNYATHKHPKVKAWLAARPRWHVHFIPTYSSWLNPVERFFALLSDKTIRRGSFHSVRDLVAKIDHFVTHYNQTCKPFVWTATADSILAKLQRLCQRYFLGQHTSGLDHEFEEQLDSLAPPCCATAAWAQAASRSIGSPPMRACGEGDPPPKGHPSRYSSRGSYHWW